MQWLFVIYTKTLYPHGAYDRTDMVSYYDFVLGLIPLALFGVSGAFHVGGLPVVESVTVGGLLAVALVAHALFVRAPTDTFGTHDA